MDIGGLGFRYLWNKRLSIRLIEGTFLLPVHLGLLAGFAP